MRKHRDADRGINRKLVPADLYQAPAQSWDEAVELGEQFGYRNAQATVLAPTGTIGFMMDCDTTGVEPDIALVKYKKLVGGGMMKIVNSTVPMALAQARLHRDSRSARSSTYIDEHETIEGAPHLKDAAPAGVRLRLQGGQGRALDPLHGPHPDDGRRRSRSSPARSARRSTCPKDATVEEIEEAYLESLEARRQGRLDLPRRQQAHAAAEHLEGQAGRAGAGGGRRGGGAGRRPPVRRKLPDERHSITHKFDIAGHEGYITVGLFEDGQPGEIFLVMAKEGSTISGFADAFAQAICYALQYGVPLQVLVDKFSHVRFEPSGMTKNPEVRFAKSIVDYIFRWMATKFLSPEAQFAAGVNNRDEVVEKRQRQTARVGEPPTPGRDRHRPEAVARRARRGDSEPGRRAAVLDLRVDHDAQRQLLQVRQLRHDERLRVRTPGLGARVAGARTARMNANGRGWRSGRFVFR